MQVWPERGSQILCTDVSTISFEKEQKKAKLNQIEKDWNSLNSESQWLQ